MSSVVLTYFRVKARAEAIKIALYLAHIPFEFKIISGWAKIKEEGLKDFSLPFGQVPVLHIDDMDITQSMTILRYISRNYLSKDVDKKTEVYIDMMNDGWIDLQNAYYSVMHSEKEKIEAFIEGEGKRQLHLLENFYKHLGKKFLVSDKPTIADANAFAIIDKIADNKSDLLSDFPALTEWQKAMKELPELKEYFA